MDARLGRPAGRARSRRHPVRSARVPTRLCRSTTLPVARLRAERERARRRARADRWPGCTSTTPTWGSCSGWAERTRRRFDVSTTAASTTCPSRWRQPCSAPMVTTLHTPPVPGSSRRSRCSADRQPSSRSVRRRPGRWAGTVPAAVIHNGVDIAALRTGPGGGPAVWTGRMVPREGTARGHRRSAAGGRRARPGWSCLRPGLLRARGAASARERLPVRRAPAIVTNWPTCWAQRRSPW